MGMSSYNVHVSMECPQGVKVRRRETSDEVRKSQRGPCRVKVKWERGLSQTDGCWKPSQVTADGCHCASSSQGVFSFGVFFVEMILMHKDKSARSIQPDASPNEVETPRMRNRMRLRKAKSSNFGLGTAVADTC